MKPFFTAAAIFLLSSTATPSARRPELLVPTGSAAVGRITFAWQDSRRKDETSDTVAAREVRVHIFYPARRTRGAVAAPYHPDLSRIERYGDDHFGKGYLREDFGSSYSALMSMRGHSFEGAPALGRERTFPVVVFSHGGGIQVLFYSSLFEELASHGYVVAAVEHPHDADLVILPEGRFIEQRGWDLDPQRSPAERAAFHRRRHEVDAQDNSFVLDQLARINSGEISSPLRGRLDLKRVAAAGHSLGGMVAVVSCAQDSRWAACVNLDGGLDPGEKYPPVIQPVLAIFGGPSPVKLPLESDEMFARRRERNAAFLKSSSHLNLVAQYANVQQCTLVYISSPGFSHFSYYDLSKPEGEPWGGTPERTRRNLSLIRECLTAFLDSAMSGRQTPFARLMRRVDKHFVILPLRALHK